MFLFSFIRKLFYCLIIYPGYAFLSLNSSQFLPIFLPTQSNFIFATHSKTRIFLRDNSKYKKIKQKLSHQTWTRSRNRRENAQERDMNRRPNHSFTQVSHKNTELEVTIYNQRAWCRTIQALCLLPSSQ